MNDMSIETAAGTEARAIGPREPGGSPEEGETGGGNGEAVTIDAPLEAAAMGAAAAAETRKLARPSADIRLGAIVAIAFFVLFLGWAAIFRLDAAARASGELIVSGERQSVQHRDGGMIDRIYVHDGQQVRQGQLLISLTSPEVSAQVASLQSQVTQALAQRAELQAELSGASRLETPGQFLALQGEDRAEADAALQQQAKELQLRRATREAQVASLRARAGEYGQLGRGYGAQSQAAAEQVRLIDEQLHAYAPLADKGFISKSRIRELERARAALQGEAGQSQASIAQSGASADEARLQALESERSFHERAIGDLRDAENRLGDLEPRLAAARDQLAHTQVRAPVSGAVVALNVFTPGGVIAAGQKLMDIVPESRPLVVKVRIAPDDADDLAVGSPALVRFSGLHDRALPDLHGRLVRLSADVLTDEKAGVQYFGGEVDIPVSEYGLVRSRHGNSALRAGMPAQVQFPLRARTALDYLLEPLTEGFSGAFHEH